MSRKFFVGGNWKMNGDKAAIDGIIAFLNKDGGISITFSPKNNTIHGFKIKFIKIVKFEI